MHITPEAPMPSRRVDRRACGLLTIVPLLLLAFPPAAAAAPEPALQDLRQRQVESYRRDHDVSAATAERNLAAQRKGVRVVEELEALEGGTYAGVWFDNDAGEFVVPVVAGENRNAVAESLAASSRLSAADFRTTEVRATWRQLELVHEQVDEALSPLIDKGVIATSIDPRTNAVVIHQSEDIAEADRGRVHRVAREQGGFNVEVRREASERLAVGPSACVQFESGWEELRRTCDKPLRGGVTIAPSGEDGQGFCTAAFKALGNVYGNRFVLTAGHCYRYEHNWEPYEKPHWRSWDGEEAPHYLGKVEQATYPSAELPATGDWAKIRVNGSTAEGDQDWWEQETSWPSRVAYWGGNQNLPVERESPSFVGQSVCYTGAASGSGCGTVTAFDKTQAYYELYEEEEIYLGTVQHLTEASGSQWGLVGGDSGGPVWSGTAESGINAHGVISGGPNGSTGFGVYVEIIEAADAMGVTVGTRETAPPSAETAAATGVEGRQATFNGKVDPNGLSTNYRFEYQQGLESFNSTQEWGAGAGWGAVGVSKTVTGLRPDSYYDYRVVATNSKGVSTAPTMEFYLPSAAPLAITGDVTHVGVEEETGHATLTGTVEPGGLSTDYQFEWGLTDSYGNQAPQNPKFAGSDAEDIPVSAEIQGLVGQTTYHYRLRAENSKGEGQGEDETFATPDWSPAVTTDGSEDGPSHNRTLHATIDPNGFSTEYGFEYGPSKSYGEFVSSVQPLLGDGGYEVSLDTAQLKGQTTYYYRAFAVNEGNGVEEKRYGEEKFFTTPDWRPAVTTRPATSVTTTEVEEGEWTADAELRASINPNGYASTYQLEYADDATFLESGWTGAAVVPESPASVGSGTKGVEVEQQIEGLAPITLYHSRIVGENIEGASYGADRTSTTPPPRQPLRFDADFHPAVIDGQQSEAEPLVLQAGSASVSCDVAFVYGEATAPSTDLNLEAEFSGCADAESEAPATVEMKSCRLELGLLNEGPAYAATAGVGCAEEGDGIVVKTYEGETVRCTITYQAQAGADGVWLLNTGNGVERGIEAELATVHLSAYFSGGIGNCGVGNGVHDTTVSGVVNLYGEDGSKSPAGLFVSGEPTRGVYVSGEESEEAEEQPRFDGEEHPLAVAGEQSEAEPISFEAGIQTMSCERAYLEGETSEPSATQGLEAQFAGCSESAFERKATIETNSCQLEVGLLNEGPPYVGALGVGCAEEGDGIVVTTYSGGVPWCTITYEAQEPAEGVALSSFGEEAASGIEASIEGVEMPAYFEGGYFKCGTATGVHETTVSGAFELRGFE